MLTKWNAAWREHRMFQRQLVELGRRPLLHGLGKAVVAQRLPAQPTKQSKL